MGGDGSIELWTAGFGVGTSVEGVFVDGSRSLAWMVDGDASLFLPGVGDTPSSVAGFGGADLERGTELPEVWALVGRSRISPRIMVSGTVVEAGEVGSGRLMTLARIMDSGTVVEAGEMGLRGFDCDILVASVEEELLRRPRPSARKHLY